MPPDESVPNRLVLTFKVAGHTCAIPAERVSEVLLFPALARLPVQPPLLDGFLNLRGTVIPVVSLHGLFGFPVPVPEVHTPLMVLSVGNALLAFRADRMEDVTNIADDDLRPYSRQDSFNHSAEAQFERNGHEVILLSPDLLLLAKERLCLDQLQQEEQRRLERLGSGCA